MTRNNVNDVCDVNFLDLGMNKIFVTNKVLIRKFKSRSDFTLKSLYFENLLQHLT